MHPKNLRIVLITGGAQSGKSAYAIKLAESIKGRKVYLATAQSLDEEMRDKIKRHRDRRSKGFRTIEEPIQIVERLKELSLKNDVIVVDCLTLWLSNLLKPFSSNKQDGLSAGVKPSNVSKIILNKVDSLIKVCSVVQCNVVFVTNEVGMGIVPENTLGRLFRELLGTINKRIAEKAEEVILMVSGLPVKIK